MISWRHLPRDASRFVRHQIKAMLATQTQRQTQFVGNATAPLEAANACETAQDAANEAWNARYSDGAAVPAKNCCLDYTQHPWLYRRAIAERASSSPDVWWLDDIASKYLTPPAGHVLALGCGIAEPE